MREPSANSRELAWAWGQTSGDPGSFWRQVQCGSVHMATAVPQTVGSAVSLHFRFWLFRQAITGFNKTWGNNTKNIFFLFTAVTVQEQA